MVDVEINGEVVVLWMLFGGCNLLMLMLRFDLINVFCQVCCLGGIKVVVLIVCGVYFFLGLEFEELEDV